MARILGYFFALCCKTIAVGGHTPDFYQGKTDFPRAKLSEVNSSRVLFYLGEKILKRHTTLGLQEWVKKDLVLDGFPRAKSWIVSRCNNLVAARLENTNCFCNKNSSSVKKRFQIHLGKKNEISNSKQKQILALNCAIIFALAAIKQQQKDLIDDLTECCMSGSVIKTFADELSLVNYLEIGNQFSLANALG